MFRYKGQPSSSFARPCRVKREDFQLGYRADIIIQWKNNSFSHVEVKIGDQSLAKTYSTGMVLQKKYSAPDNKWNNFILLMSQQLTDWETDYEKDTSGTVVKSITWEDVCVAIRRSLLSKESITWKALAYSFVGAIEQRIVGFPGYRLHDKPVEQLDQKLEILTKGLYHEKSN